MNCQDISRLVDTGSFSKLGATERREAEAHALTCRHCAPVWAAHAALAGQRIAPMPAELAARVRVLAALPAPARSGRTFRRLTLVGSVVALAAAAGLVVYRNAAPVSEPEVPAAIVALEPQPAPSTPTSDAATPLVSEAASTPTERAAMTTPQPLPRLPLLPVPVYGGEAERRAQVDLAWQKAADAYPELVQGPEIQDTFVVGVAMRANGTVLSTAIEPAVRAFPDIASASTRIERTLPKDGANTSADMRPLHSLLNDGRMLRANVRLQVAVVSNNYDVTRSNVRVLQILGNRYADQMMPASSPDMNRLTIFLSEDGRIQREKLDKYSSPAGTPRTLIGGDANDANFLARSIAGRLEMDASEIGLVGVTSLEEGSRVLVMDASGNMRPDDNRRVLPVYYAWPRRDSDQGPVFSQRDPSSGGSTLDHSAALRIVEREIPDAFTLKDRTTGEPTIVLTAKGEVIRAGRVNYRKNGGGAMDTILQEQLVPGVRTNSFSTVRLTNNLGETADVMFAWEMPEETRAAHERAEAERAAKQAPGAAR